MFQILSPTPCDCSTCLPNWLAQMQSCIAAQSWAWVRRSAQIFAWAWKKAPDQAHEEILAWALNLSSLGAMSTVNWRELKIKAHVQISAWTWAFLAHHRSELSLIWTLWTIYNSAQKWKIWHLSKKTWGPQVGWLGCKWFSVPSLHEAVLWKKIRGLL